MSHLRVKVKGITLSPSAGVISAEPLNTYPACNPEGSAEDVAAIAATM